MKDFYHRAHRKHREEIDLLLRARALEEKKFILLIRAKDLKDFHREAQRKSGGTQRKYNLFLRTRILLEIFTAGVAESAEKKIILLKRAREEKDIHRGAQRKSGGTQRRNLLIDKSKKRKRDLQRCTEKK